MKIAIFTVFSSRNFGSYWQGKTLYDYLESLGHDVWFFDTKSRDVNEYIVKPINKETCKALLKGKFNNAKFAARQKQIYLDNLKKVKVVYNKEDLKDFDYLIFGSDEIWNVKRDHNRKYPVLWGIGFEDYKKIAYAPSINMATEDDLIKCGFSDVLKTYDKLSARDRYSVKTLSKIYDKEITQVLDPTFLVEEDYYRQFKLDHIDGKYIAVYMFNMSDDNYKRVRTIADRLKLKLVRVGAYDKRFDECVLGENVFAYLQDAEYVFANSFHGTAFSINFQKQFIVLNDANQIKINSLLEQFGLEDREMHGADIEDIFSKMMEHPIDWNDRGVELAKQRETSRNYLKSALV